MLLFLLACNGDKQDSADDTQPSTDDTQITSDSGDTETPDDTGPTPSSCEPAGTGAAAISATDAPKNLLFISIDTVRRDRIGRYSGGTQTPFLDELMDEGVVLDDHQSCSNWTYPSMLCLLSGQNTLSLGFEPTVYYGAPELFPAGKELLADWLSDAGYQTAMVSASPYLMSTYGTVEGFDTAIGNAQWKAEEAVTQALDVASNLSTDEPFYLHLHLLDPHASFSPPEDYIDGNVDMIGYDLSTGLDLNRLVAEWAELDQKTQDVALEVLFNLYDGELRYTDAMVRRLVTTMGGMGLIEDTLVVVVSDHGEGMFDHQDSQGHGHTLYEEETRGLAFFWMADGLTPLAFEGPTTHEDITPTIFDALGLAQRDAFSGSVVGTAHEDRVRSMVRYEGDVTIQAAQLGDWKLQTHWDGSSELYDLGSDPTQLTDLTGQLDDESVEACLWERIDADAAALVEQYDKFQPADWKHAP